MLPRKIAHSIPTPSAFNVSRRGFLISAAATATGLAIGFKPLSGQAADSAAINPLAAYLEIAQDGSITVLSSQFEMGQGSYHGIATLVVEELGASWSQIDVRGATGDVALYGNSALGGAAQLTGGSTSMVTSWERYRLAAATAREMLIAAAAAEWGVPASEI
ncbi:MAG TPA: twin-arginine translocation pathway signal protein, partial [Rhodospirillaceae bacterium]|nr:twin-arginine translocation pathway signal protein [Rhodospirillaceae bacterium]